MPKCNIKYCIVPKCVSTTRNSPNKYFFTMPQCTERRSVWMKKCRRKDVLSEKSTVCVCEDHFDYKEDFDNYREWSLTKCRPRLKRNAVPSKFACQGVVVPSVGRLSSLKRKRKEIVNEMLKEDDSTARAEDAESLDGVQHIIGCSDAAETPVIVTPPRENEESDSSVWAEKTRGPKPKGTHFRSRGIQVNMKSSERRPELVDACISPMKCTNEKKISVDDIFSSDSSVSSTADLSHGDSLFEPTDSDSDTEKYNVNLNSLMTTRFHDLHDSGHYMGVPSSCLFLFSLLEKRLVYSGKYLEKRDVVALIFRKVRNNFPFKTLSHQYGISESYAAKLFNHHIKSVSSAMRQLIRWLPPRTVFENLPMAFWSRFRETYAIIDTFEIQIEKPSNAFDQSETYSDYKKCNTLKYLICASPDGTVMYVSQGFLGRFSDVQITIKSDFLKSLPHNVHIMADRGFKGLESLLTQRGMQLVRPPSVASGEVVCKSKAVLGKKVASLRIHIERCIGRLRSFYFLAPHSTIAHQLQNCCDDAVIIACALMNCSSPLIKI